MALYFGIDPGVSGGVAVLSESGSVIVLVPMPKTPQDLIGCLKSPGEPRMIREGAYAVLERVWCSPQMGVVSAFTFGQNVGALKQALAAVGIPYDEVLPSTWQRAMGCRVGPSRAGGGRGGNKNITKARAQALFPGLRVTHATADALLLAEYARRYDRGLWPAGGTTDGKEKARTETREGQGPRRSKSALAQAWATITNAPGDGASPRRPSRRAV